MMSQKLAITKGKTDTEIHRAYPTANSAQENHSQSDPRSPSAIDGDSARTKA